MSMRFAFSDDFNGLTAQLFNTNGPMPIFMDSEMVDDGQAVFAFNAFNGFALRLRDSNGAFVRSGRRNLNIGRVDPDTSDFSVTYFVVHLDPVVIAPGAVGGLVPPPPIVTPEAIILSITLAIAGTFLRATGSALYTASPLGTIPVTYTYDFNLVPAQDPVTTGTVLEVETITASVRGASGGLLGWLVNFFVDILIAIMYDNVVTSIESSVQASVDAAIGDSMASQGAPDGATVTVRTISIDTTNGISVNPFVALSQDIVCGSLPTSGSIEVRSPDQIKKLRLMRDRTLRYTPQGDAYIRAFEAASPELVEIFVTHSDILKKADQVIAAGLKEYREDSPGKGVLSDRTAKMATELMEMVAKVASPELAQTIRAVIPDVKSFIGRPVAEVLAQSLKELE